jgi:hypothetical protein
VGLLLVDSERIRDPASAAQFIPGSFPRDARIVMCALAAFESDLCIEIR